jgi:hypothetical protein
LGYIEEKRKQRKKALMGQVCTVERGSIGIIVFQVRGRDKTLFFFVRMGSCRINYV